MWLLMTTGYVANVYILVKVFLSTSEFSVCMSGYYSSVSVRNKTCAEDLKYYLLRKSTLLIFPSIV